MKQEQRHDTADHEEEEDEDKEADEEEEEEEEHEDEADRQPRGAQNTEWLKQPSGRRTREPVTGSYGTKTSDGGSSLSKRTKSCSDPSLCAPDQLFAATTHSNALIVHHSCLPQLVTLVENSQVFMRSVSSPVRMLHQSETNLLAHSTVPKSAVVAAVVLVDCVHAAGCVRRR